MATFAIGDIHGCFTALTNVLEAAAPGTDDTLVFLGDYVDRGPDSRKVVDYILGLQKLHRVITLRGNHEIMMLDSRTDREKLFMWQHFGGEQTLESYTVGDGELWQDCVPQEHWDFFANTSPFHETDSHIFVHAGLSPKKALKEQDDAALYWKKYRNPSRFARDKTVICGHTAREIGEIADYGHTVCIDTYAYGGQWLTCLNVNSDRYWQANQDGEVRTGSRDT